MPITLTTDFHLNEDQTDRILTMLRANGHIDYEDMYATATGKRARCVAMHFLKEPLDGISGGETTIDSIDDIRFDKPPSIYIEDAEGALTGWKQAREWIESSWNCGVIFKDDDGQAWFCGRQTVESVSMDSEAPILRRVSLETPEFIFEGYGLINDNLPAEGEFWLSHEEQAVVTSIPWWSHCSDGTDPEPFNAEVAENDRAAIERMKLRVRALSAKPEDALPSPE